MKTTNCLDQGILYQYSCQKSHSLVALLYTLSPSQAKLSQNKVQEYRVFSNSPKMYRKSKKYKSKQWRRWCCHKSCCHPQNHTWHHQNSEALFYASSRLWMLCIRKRNMLILLLLIDALLCRAGASCRLCQVVKSVGRTFIKGNKLCSCSVVGSFIRPLAGWLFHSFVR